MHATFFVAPRAEALTVGSVEDLPGEVLGEPLALSDATGLAALLRVVSKGGESLEPLRDATCRSFPVFEVGDASVRAIRCLDDPALEEVAEEWRRSVDDAAMDADLHELSTLLGDIRAALQSDEAGDHRLYVLVEEKAL